MSAAAVSLVLGAALLHALWNAAMKASSDRMTTLAMISVGHILCGAVLAMLVPLPSPESWPYLAVSTAVHAAYYLFLVLAYRVGDLSLVYPVARGISPVVVAAVATTAAGEVLPLAAWGGIAAISLAILLVAVPAVRGESRGPALALAIGTGLCIAGYSLIDGLGVRLAGAPASYIAWLFILEVFIAVPLLLLRKPAAAKRRSVLAAGLAGGLVSGGAYAIVLFVKSFAPLGLVTALREVSVVIAALIGVTVFRERPLAGRVAASGAVAAGIWLIATSAAASQW